MMWDETAEFESDPRFPSGPWEGFWAYDGELASMNLYMQFVGGRVRGEGSDRIGMFDITGRYWTRHGTVVLRKHYRGYHVVRYRGSSFFPYLKGESRIASALDHGRWRIWPVEEEFELTRLVIETTEGPFLVHGEVTENDKETFS